MNGDKINGRTPEEIKKKLGCLVYQEDGACEEYYTCHGCSNFIEVYMGEGECFETTLAYIQQLEAAAPKWISVEERLPQAFYSVLVYIPEEAPMPTVHEGYMADNGRWISTVYVREFEKVTHWMYMPEPPKEVQYGKPNQAE